MGQYRILIIIGVLVGLLSTIWYLRSEVNTLKDQLDVSVANEKSLLRENVSWQDKYGRLNTSAIQLQLSFKGLQSTNDSLLLKIYDYAKKSNKKRAHQGGIITSTIDTTFIPVPISINRDTCITFGDRWLKNEVCLRDGTLVSRVEVTNEQVLFWENKRETIKPRAKFFLKRWFQRKHTVTEVTVINGNPHIKQQHTKFVNFSK